MWRYASYGAVTLVLLLATILAMHNRLEKSDEDFLLHSDCLTLEILGQYQTDSFNKPGYFRGHQILRSVELKSETEKERLLSILNSDLNFGSFHFIGVGCHKPEYALVGQNHGKELALSISYGCRRLITIHDGREDSALSLAGDKSNLSCFFQTSH